MTNNLTPSNEYFIFLLPPNTRVIKTLIDELLDMLEYQDSVIYHEFPDKNALLRELETVYNLIIPRLCRKCKVDNSTTKYNLEQVGKFLKVVNKDE